MFESKIRQPGLCFARNLGDEMELHNSESGHFTKEKEHFKVDAALRARGDDANGKQRIYRGNERNFRNALFLRGKFLGFHKAWLWLIRKTNF